MGGNVNETSRWLGLADEKRRHFTPRLMHLANTPCITSQQYCASVLGSLQFAPRNRHYTKEHPMSAKFLCTHIAFVAAALSLSVSAWAVPDAHFLPLFEQFEVLNNGDTSKLEKVSEGFAALLKTEPTNPVLLAYVGTTTAMKSNTTMLPWKKMSYAEDGMAMLDKAIAMLTPQHDKPIQHDTPGSLEVKLLAANTFLKVPGFMNKGPRGVKLASELIASPLLAASPVAFQGVVWMTAGEAAVSEKRTNDARKHFNKVIELKAPQSDAARAQLAKLAQ